MELSGRTIVIDASIYLYKFKGDGGLIEGIFQLISLFKYYNIIPVFVFDGKPPPEKYKELQKRRDDKYAAEAQYNVTRQLGIDEGVTKEISTKLNVLRSKFIRLTTNDINSAKKLISLLGVKYYQCDGESDAICVRLVHQGLAYACMSEDMDMFVYGCPIVLKYLNLFKATIVLYDLKGILKTLGYTFDEFQDICMISGTDYTEASICEFALEKSLRLYKEYKYINNQQELRYSAWAIMKNYIQDADKFTKILEIFDISELQIPEENCIESVYNKEGVKKFLLEYGYIFI